MTTLPPGPRGRLGTLWRYVRDPYRETVRLFDQYGDPCTLRTIGPPLVTTSDPQLIRTILAADPAGYDAFGIELLGPVLGPESLILLSGPRHRAARTLLSPPFHGARVRAYGRAMQAITRDEIGRWQPGRRLVMQEVTRSISLRVILQAVFGITDPVTMARYEHALVAAVSALTPALLFVEALRHDFGGLGPWARLQRRTRVVETMIYAELAARRAAPALRDDILSLVMAARYDDGGAMTDRQLFETLMTIVVAGHETSAIAAAWACYFVHRDPAVRDRLLAELAGLGDDDDPDAITRLPYLGAVCDETLRLHPVAGSVARTLNQPMQLGAWSLPAGVAVSPSIIGLHRRPELYPEPEAFRPQRFLERKFAPHEYMPFGGGHRRCIGAAFASYELKVVVATLLGARPLRLVTERPVGARPRSTVIGPAQAIEFVLA